MKKSFVFFLMVLLSSGHCLFQDALAQTSTELLNKAIAFHDPLKKWTNYSGKVHLTTVFSRGNSSGGEIIEIQTKDNYYKCIGSSSKVVKGVQNGECFREIDGNTRPDEGLIKKSNLTDENVLQSKNWHYFHLGIPMELAASGLVLQKDVETVNIQGMDYKALKFLYDASQLKNQFYKDSNFTVYLNPDDYSVKGFRIEGVMNMYALFSGLLTINDIKIPLCRTYFSNKDNSFFMVDVFSSVNQ